MPGWGKAKGFMERLITPEKAAELMEEGWMRADLHVHTACSYDVLPVQTLKPESLYRKALEADLDYITFTDHDTMEAYEALGWDREKLVPGVEMTVLDMERVGHTVHVNVFELDKEEFKELFEIAGEERNLRSFVRYLHKHDLPYMYNHPFWCEFQGYPNLSAIPDIARLFPVIEYNLHELKQKNELAICLAEKCKKGIAASTDTHSGKLGQVCTLAKGDNFKEFFRNIARGKNCIVPENLSRELLIEEMNTWIELSFDRKPEIGVKERFLTGIKCVDAVFKISRSEVLNYFPSLNRTAMNLLSLVSNSGLPASYYLHSEESLAREIEKNMRFEIEKI